MSQIFSKGGILKYSKRWKNTVFWNFLKIPGLNSAGGRNFFGVLKNTPPLKCPKNFLRGVLLTGIPLISGSPQAENCGYFKGCLQGGNGLKTQNFRACGALQGRFCCPNRPKIWGDLDPSRLTPPLYSARSAEKGGVNRLDISWYCWETGRGSPPSQTTLHNFG